VIQETWISVIAVFLGVLGTRVGSLESAKIIIGSLKSAKVRSLPGT